MLLCTVEHWGIRPTAGCLMFLRAAPGSGRSRLMCPGLRSFKALQARDVEQDSSGEPASEVCSFGLNIEWSA
jgi:hypothetical protein